MSKRMKLISDVDYDRLMKSTLPTDSKEASFHDKNITASKLLDVSSIADDIKLALYNTLIKGINDKLSQLVSEPIPVRIENTEIPQPTSAENNNTEPATSNELVDSHLLSILPQSFRKPALYIMQILRQYEYIISWDATGEVKFDDVRCVGSNIVDLLSYVLRPKLKFPDGQPVGGKRFLYALRACSVPLVVLGVTLRRTLQTTSISTLKKRRTLGPTAIVAQQINDEDIGSQQEGFFTPASSINNPKRWQKFERRVPE